LFFALGEAVVRVGYLTSEYPQRFIDDDALQKYIPGQTGYHKGGIKWEINSKGWSGCWTEPNENFISIIGDSYIENFMNPISCHQCSILEKNFPDYQINEYGRSGFSFLESLIVSKQLAEFKPKIQLIYVNLSDFAESIKGIRRLTDRVQYDLKKNEIVYSKLKNSKLKKVLYSCKFVYYLYSRFPLFVAKQNIGGVNVERDLHLEKVKTFLAQMHNDFYNENIVLVFNYNVPIELVDLAKEVGFRCLKLSKADNENWEFENDIHWTCYGHKQVAQQVSKLIEEI